MGAGIPRAIPGILDRLSEGEPCPLRLDVSVAVLTRTSRFTSIPASYVQKGGSQEQTEDHVWLYNALAANVGLGQVREDGLTERPLVTRAMKSGSSCVCFRRPKPRITRLVT